MRFVISMALLCLLAFSAPSLAVTIYVDDLGDGQTGNGMASNPYRSLQVAIDRAFSGDTIFIRTGEYGASPVIFTDGTCGNCSDSGFYRSILATHGFYISGKSLVLLGESRHSTILHTNAGYGIFFEDAGTSRIENLTVTGGIRDYDHQATNGAIVARRTALTVRNATLIDNNHLPAGTPPNGPGICGIAGREGSVITADNLLIYNNSWDGIALYRGAPGTTGLGARATITNVTISQGKGVGIGVTWDAQADITNAHISSYWGGVGSFGTSRVTLRNSFLRDQEDWGVVAYGRTSVTAVNNLILDQGGFGLGQVTSDATVTFVNNIIYGNGRNPSAHVAHRAGVWLVNPNLATVTHNDFYYNSLADACSGPDCTPLNLIGSNGNISADPSFVNGNAHDFTLLCNSPALNTGSPAILDTDGTRSDMGLYGGPASVLAPPACRADLTPTAIVYNPADLVAGREILFDSGVQNLYNVPTVNFQIKWYIDNVEVRYGVHRGMPGNAIVLNENSAYRWTATRGTHTITYVIDTLNQVPELNENNNSRSITVTVP